MPKPVKKAASESTTKRASSDPVTRARQLQAEHEAKVARASPPWVADTGTVDRAGRFTPDPPGPGIMEPTFAERFSSHMKALGAKGGRVSGAKRMEMPEAKRKAIAKKAAAARWGKKPSNDGSR